MAMIMKIKNINSGCKSIAAEQNQSEMRHPNLSGRVWNNPKEQKV